MMVQYDSVLQREPQKAQSSKDEVRFTTRWNTSLHKLNYHMFSGTPHKTIVGNHSLFAEDSILFLFTFCQLFLLGPLTNKKFCFTQQLDFFVKYRTFWPLFHTSENNSHEIMKKKCWSCGCCFIVRGHTLKKVSRIYGYSGADVKCSYLCFHWCRFTWK